MKKKNTSTHIQDKPVSKERLRKAAEGTATFGLLLVCVGLVAPFAAIGSPEIISWFKWIFAAGAVIYTVARMINVNEPGDSFRVRRLRRLEMWAGFAFLIAAFFWFYNAYRFAAFGFILKTLQETILFTLVGALIQIIASWMLAAALKKQAKENTSKNS